jgi:kynureninase
MQAYRNTVGYARQRDITDPLAAFRNEFHFPLRHQREAVYFCGNSLGLQPKNAAAAIAQELKDWQELAIGGFYRAKNPWLYYHQPLAESLTGLAGAQTPELTVMNTLTVNLHLLLLTFYRPAKNRFKIIMEAGAFPSDQYAVETQALFYGFDPEKTIVEVTPRPGEKLIREEDILQTIETHRDQLALVLFGGINYYTGQVLNIRDITAAAHRAGAFAGFDLAHAIGNIPLQLHDWQVDFAVWCSYKYLNGGPGAAGGLFIHERFARDTRLNRLGGWWGNDEQTRFRMEKGFIPKPDAGGWAQSTAQIFNMVCVKASLDIFKRTSIAALRAKSVELTAYLEFLLKQLVNLPCELITPEHPDQRGAQLSLFFASQGKEIYDRMLAAGIVVDYREPGVIRVAPAPLYNSFEDVWRFYDILSRF